MKKNLLANDLDYILLRTQSIWDELKGQRIFITGGTGFFGSWLLETFSWANEKLNLGLFVEVLTRNQSAFLDKVPHLKNNSAIQFHMGDVRDYIFPTGLFPYVIHAATESSARLNQENPGLMSDTILQGTQHTLNFAQQAGVKKFLFVSSGAIYGKQPPQLEHVDEEYTGKPDAKDILSAYAISKYQAEQACITHQPFEMKIARCFAFVGPYLPLDRHFAIGNFIRDALLQKTILVNGDGTPYRSYLYAADLVIWLLHILCHGTSCVAYNVGSDEAISIAELAHVIADCFHQHPEIKIATISDSKKLPERYVPSVQRAVKQFKLEQQISLVDAIKKTIAWHQDLKR